MNEIRAYQCDHCYKITRQKGNMKIHESKCFKNPETKSCITCAYFSDNNEIKPKSCYKGKDLSKKLITKCNKYFSLEEYILTELKKEPLLNH